MKTIFWNVDTQYDFMRPDGKLYVPGAEKIENKLEGLTKFAKDKGIKVVNTADWHNKYSKELSDNPDFIETFPEHCMENTLGADYVPATKPKNHYAINWQDKDFDNSKVFENRNIVLYKDKFDVFAGTPHSDKLVELLNPESAVVYGVASNVCVNDAVNGLLKRKVKVYVPTDAIKELPNIPLPFEDWEKKGAVLTDTDGIYRILGGDS